jgi:multidrug resistance efflux pump
LASAKNDYLSAAQQSMLALKLLERHKQTGISKQGWADAEDRAWNSNLALQVAREELRVFGLVDEAIGRVGQEDAQQKARLTLRAPIDGVIQKIDAKPGNIYDSRGVLMEIIAETSEPSPRSRVVPPAGR